MRIRTYFISVVFLFTSGCINLSIKQLTGPYYLTEMDEAPGIGLYLHTESSFYGTVISPEVFQADWNDNLILIKQHPGEVSESAKREFVKNLILAETQKAMLNKRSSDRKEIDSLDLIIEEVNRNLSNNQILKDSVCYYLIDVKSQRKFKLLLDSESQCDSLINLLRLTKNKTYHFLF